MPNTEPTFSELSGRSRDEYQREMLALHGAFKAGTSGTDTIHARSEAVDRLVRGLWRAATGADSGLLIGIAILAIGGYGRGELFPCSDVDLMFLVATKEDEETWKDSIRLMSQALWDCGLRVSAFTRSVSECEHLALTNVEGWFALLTARPVAGNLSLAEALIERTVTRGSKREALVMMRRLHEITLMRHRRWGDTLFHLEPNIKECPGGLRDVHVCLWLGILKKSGLRAGGVLAGEATRNDDGEFSKAVEFMTELRCFLHYQKQRDDNRLDWQAQDAAAAAAIGMSRSSGVVDETVDAAFWMRQYFRHARVIARRATQSFDETFSNARQSLPKSLLPQAREAHVRRHGRSKLKFATNAGSERIRVEQGVLVVDEAVSVHEDPAADPEVVLTMFALMSEYGLRLDRRTEDRLIGAVPELSNHLEEGPGLWRYLSAILCGRYAGAVLRTMHASGVLELLIPEFHGIDALVIRDAYHRYTVDEHTFVLIDTLHHLGEIGKRRADRSVSADRDSVEGMPASAAQEWAGRFGQLLRDLQHPSLLYLAALLHDTGKGRSSDDHAVESARLAEGLLSRLELDQYERSLVLGLITRHLEMSSALRRDIFDIETIKGFAVKIQTHEALRMLALFTYADIQAVHPDALTPWKAENLWRLYVATSNELDRSIDEERLDGSDEDEFVQRVAAGVSDRRSDLDAFLLGLPKRYLRTRTPEQVRGHFEATLRLAEDPVQIELVYSTNMSEVTLITRDRPRLFTSVAGALAAWGMNIVTAEAFSNQQGLVVDMFRITDPFRTLEMNVVERERFVSSLQLAIAGVVPTEAPTPNRRRTRRRSPLVTVRSSVDFDDDASSHSTLMQVMAQDTSGLLYVISAVLAVNEINLDVALIDTEGEMAIDVFYLTREGRKLTVEERDMLRASLLEAIDAHTR